MLRGIHKLLDEADAVVHYNGSRFDIPTINKEFLLHGFPPPQPYKQIDLLKVARQKFRFPSNKLDYVARALGFEGKVRHIGHELWVKCMNDDPAAWKDMEHYNKGDVLLLEKVYEKLLPWVSSHPNHGLYTDGTRPVCTNCGGEKMQRRGFERTRARIYRRYQCQLCRTWMRSTALDMPEPQKEHLLVQV
jgi:DNA polymerase III epsilon subunit-like protein